MRTLIFGFVQAALALLAAVLMGCVPAQSSGPAPHVNASAVEPTDSVMTDSVNYMHERAVKYTLYDLMQNPPAAVGGAIVDFLGTGGEKGCCLALPKQWKPGMKVRLQWHESDRKQIYPEEYSRDLEIPSYESPADLYVVFYPPHDVEVVVSEGEPGNEQWQGRIKKTPWEQCVESYGRMPCKAALPKQFDIDSYRGYCAVAIAEKRANAEENCAFETHECMVDYEDEAFCRSVLWSARRK